MKSKSMVWAGIACAALTACGTTGRSSNPFAPHFFTARTECKVADCSIDVTVTQNAAAGTCIPAVVPIIDVRPGPASQRRLSWTISTDGFEFSREEYKYGIFIKSDPLEEFKDAQITNGGKTLTLRFSNAIKGKTYEYALTVRRSRGGKEFCETLDPWLIS